MDSEMERLERVKYIKEQFRRLTLENVELDAALADSMLDIEKLKLERDRWAEEARYWYARAAQLATGTTPPPVIPERITDERGTV